MADLATMSRADTIEALRAAVVGGGYEDAAEAEAVALSALHHLGELVDGDAELDRLKALSEGSDSR